MFAKAATKNCYKLGGLNNRTLLFHGLEVESPKSRCWQGAFLLSAVREGSVPGLSPWLADGYHFPMSFFFNLIYFLFFVIIIFNSYFPNTFFFLLYSMMSQLHIHVYILFSHSIMLHHEWLDIVPRATQQNLITNLFQRQ